MTLALFGSKVMSHEAFRGKMVFLGCSRVIIEFLKWLEGVGAKDRGSCRIWDIFRDFCRFLEGLEWFRTYL
jgi:hypothetical protein